MQAYRDPPSASISDYAGFAPARSPRVLAVMRPFFEAGIGNPSARHSLGVEAREALDAARVKVARLCGGAASGVIFTSGATEANNLAIRGVARAAKVRGAGRVIVSAVEHVSVVNPCRELEKSGAALVFLPVDADGRVEPDAVRDALTPDTLLISVGAASGEIGTLQPLREIGHIARDAGVPFHVDAVGALGRVPLAADAMRIDLLSLSGNDLYGPPGTGALWVRPGVKLHPQVLGGGQETRLPLRHRERARSGRPRRGRRADARRVAPRRERSPGRRSAIACSTGVLDAVPDCRLTGSRRARLPHHLSLVLRGVKADDVLLDLDLAGISASTGSACAALTETPSHVLRAIGCAPDEMDGSLCFTLGRWSAPADVDTALERLPLIVPGCATLAPFAPR